jgi:hypothetical protein
MVYSIECGPRRRVSIRPARRSLPMASRIRRSLRQASRQVSLTGVGFARLKAQQDKSQVEQLDKSFNPHRCGGRAHTKPIASNPWRFGSNGSPACGFSRSVPITFSLCWFRAGKTGGLDSIWEASCYGVRHSVSPASPHAPPATGFSELAAQLDVTWALVQHPPTPQQLDADPQRSGSLAFIKQDSLDFNLPHAPSLRPVARFITGQLFTMKMCPVPLFHNSPPLCLRAGYN